MDGPGMSLFQGAASIHINNSAQDRLEEQEELEDQKRRNEELKHELANAFDDLLDDDEASSVNSSGNYTLDPAQSNGVKQTRTGLPPTYVESLNHLKENQCAESPKLYCETPKNHVVQMRHPDDALKAQFSPYGAGDGQNHYFQQEFRGHMNGVNNCERQEYMNNEQLKVLYDVRVKECQQLAGQMQKLDTEIDSLRARLTAAINDRDKAELSLQEAHHLLASSKHKLIELEQQVTALSKKLVESDQEKEQLKLEVRSANISLQDVQQKLHTLQVAHTHDTDALFREQQDRHRDEMERLQNDLTKAKNRLDEKVSINRAQDNEVKTLERRCMEKDREKEDILIEKGATINRLASELEAAQSRLVNGETTKLKEKVSQLTTERNAAREQVKEMGSKLELTAHELVLYRNKLAGTQKEYEHWRTTLHQILMESLPDNTYLGEPPSPGKLSTLKEVLSRYKIQMQKLSTLQEEIKQHRKQELDLRAKFEEQKGLEMQLNSRMAVLQNKLELLGSNSDSELLENYKQQNESLQAELEEVRSELKNACSSRDSVSRELKDLQSKTQKEKEFYKSQEKEFVERIEKQKQHIDKLMAELSDCKEELDRANKRISELQREFTDKQREFTEKLDQYLQEREPCAQCEKHVKHIKYLDDQLSKCTIRLASQESNETLMKELKGKAEFFQQYIIDRFNKLREQRSIDNTFRSQTALMMKEKAIRDQIAEKFTLEMKTVEMNCARRIKEIENEHIETVSKIKELLERKAKEVEALKEFILAERAKVTQILESKESEISELIKEHNELQVECQKSKDTILDWKQKAERYKERASRLGSLEDVLKHEREDWRQRSSSTTKECMAMKTKIAELQTKFAQLDQKIM
ncbi:hypothetical protein HF086_016545 [Spodoptera exigua]|uniref:Uncharacterized protein n=1 Tax=Spodoptera exigua TaxID=7107 RepID=A0A922SBZ7_SPOEX|nr:hypothetical protein HF086_016545 [Spodoptera exigua]